MTNADPPTNTDPAEEPTPERVATAYRLRALHGEALYPDTGICSWCLKRWPCPDSRWAEWIVRRAEQQRDTRT